MPFLFNKFFWIVRGFFRIHKNYHWRFFFVIINSPTFLKHLFVGVTNICVFCSPAIYGICNCNLALLLLWSAQKQESKKPPNYLIILMTSTFLKTVFVPFVAPDYNYKSHFLRCVAHGRMLHYFRHAGIFYFCFKV